MQKTIKNVLFGALAAMLVATAFTATAKSAYATEPCEPCGFGTGYMILTGVTSECVDDSDPRYVEQCGGGGR